MKRVFISQPMNGRTDEEIFKEREFAVARVKQILGDDISVIDSFIPDPPKDSNPMWMLGKSIELMSDADIVVFLPGWRDARGCLIEHECAEKYCVDMIIHID